MTIKKIVEKIETLLADSENSAVHIQGDDRNALMDAIEYLKGRSQ